MNKLARWLLIGVLVGNSMIAAFVLGGASYSPVHAQEPEPKEEQDPTREALRLLGEELAQRSEALEQREAEFNELTRAEELRLREALTTTPDAIADTVPGTPAQATATAEVDTSDASLGSDAAQQAFSRLSKAYENMEPESAALAMQELATIDGEAVVQLLSGWPPRTSGGILDALTQIDPGLSAKLSYEIWKRAGKDES